MDTTTQQVTTTNEAALSANPTATAQTNTHTGGVPTFAERVRNSLSKPQNGTMQHKHDHAVEPVGTPGVHQKLTFMERLRTSEFVQDVLRTLEFLSAFISFILFSIRLAKIVRLARRATHSNGAVEGILTAAVLYTISILICKFLFRKNKYNLPAIASWIPVVLDVLFVGAFIAVAYETRPHGGPSGPCGPANVSCSKLPYGTFALAIVSTILHALSAIYRQIKGRHLERQAKVLSPERVENHGDAGIDNDEIDQTTAHNQAPLDV